MLQIKNILPLNPSQKKKNLYHYGNLRCQKWLHLYIFTVHTPILTETSNIRSDMYTHRHDMWSANSHKEHTPLYLCGYFHYIFTVNITQTGSVISTGASLLRVLEHQLTIYNGSHFSEGRTVNFQTNCMSQERRSWTLGLQLIIFISSGYSENVSINFFGQMSILNCAF